MPLYGTLKSMPLPGVLQWLGNTGVTGTLRVERDRVSKCIQLKDGLIIGCSSDDPPQRLGHFLLSRGKITEEQLRQALHLQEISGQHLGTLLVEIGALEPDELSDHLEAQAEETIYSLFDWEDAAFRFQEDESNPAHVFPVSLRVEDVLLRGLKRFDEMREIRGVFDDPGIVLETTGKKPPEQLNENPIGRAIWELINGERTVAEILLQVHGSEYIVTKFLFELQRSGLVRIARVKPIAPPAKPAEGAKAETPAKPAAEAPAMAATAVVEESAEAPERTTAETTRAETAGAPAGSAAEAPQEPTAETPATVEANSAAQDPAQTVQDAGAEDQDDSAIEDLLADVDSNIDLPPAEEAPGTSAGEDAEPGEDAPPPELIAVEDSPAHVLQHNLEKARGLMAASEFEQALEVLEHVYRQQPGEESLCRMIAEAEAAFVEKAYRHFLPPSKVLVLTRMIDELVAEDLSPSEFFLLSRVDGTWDIKSIIQIAPLREADALRTLKRMRENGLIELVDP